ncbi:MAG: YSC84-related protein [Halioglobus sp.]
MAVLIKSFLLSLAMAFASHTALAGAEENVPFQEAKKAFIDAGAAEIFNTAYGYALFPSIGKGGIGIGGAHGKGRVFAGGQMTGTTGMTQITVGFQLGGQVFSQVIFFEDKRAYDEFTSGNFEFGAQATAVALTAGASASAGGGAGASVGVSGGQNNANATGSYRKGIAIYTIAKGGLMYEASLGGQKFSFTPN